MEDCDYLPDCDDISCRFSKYDTQDEYILKAIFLERFTRFVVFPVSHSKSPNFNLCVVNQSSFGQLLKQIYSQRKILNKPVRLLVDNTIQNWSECHLLFIGNVDVNRLETILDAVKTLPILVVSGSIGFGNAGVMLNFYTDKKKLRFEVNLQATQEAKIKLNYGLIQLGKKVGSLINRK